MDYQSHHHDVATEAPPAVVEVDIRNAYNGSEYTELAEASGMNPPKISPLLRRCIGLTCGSPFQPSKVCQRCPAS
jgi:hypothetical protein